MKKRLDPTNDYLRSAKKYIAIAKYNQNQLSEAQSLLQEIIKTRTKFMGEDNINLAGPYSHLAVVYQKQGEFEKAVSSQKRHAPFIKENWAKITVVLEGQWLSWQTFIAK